jgi:hypothetical protein
MQQMNAQAPIQTNSDTTEADAGDVKGTATKTDPAQTAAPTDAGDAEGGLKIHKPEGLPDHLVGANDQETIDKMHKALDGFRKDLSKKGVPESADGYELTLPDEIKAQVLRPGADGKDPLLEAMKPIAHKYNLPKEAFNEMAGEFFQAVAKVLGSADPAAQAEAGEDAPDFDFKAAGGLEKAQPRIDAANLWIKGLAESQKIPESVQKELQIMAGYTQGVETLLAIRALTGEKSIPANLGGDGPGEKISKEILDARVQDEKYWLHKDPAFIKETTEMYQKFYGSNSDK